MKETVTRNEMGIGNVISLIERGRKERMEN
jgi:hypothetical protein